MVYVNTRAIQIMPANGESALYVYRDGDTGESSLVERPLVGWALIEPTHRSEDWFVSGLVFMDWPAREVDYCEHDPHFVTYLRPGEEVDEGTRAEAERHLLDFEQRLEENRDAHRRLEGAGYQRVSTEDGSELWSGPGTWYEQLSRREALKRLGEGA